MDDIELPDMPPRQKVGGWIKCSERLPAPGVLVLVYDESFAKTDEHDSKYYCSIKRPFGVRFGSLIGSLGCMRPEGCNGDGYPITHWMPLPEPPND
jgi:hypothetical protein